MPEYRCKECGAVWHGWGAKEKPICKKCGGKLEPVLKNKPGLRKVELRVSHPPTPGDFASYLKDLNI